MRSSAEFRGTRWRILPAVRARGMCDSLRMHRLCVAFTFTVAVARRAWTEGTCGATSWAPAKDDCVCDAKGSIKLKDEDMLSWHQATAKCSEACSRCERCHFISVSLKWKDCSWYQACPAVDDRDVGRAFRTYRIKLEQTGPPAAARCPCGFHRDCMRNYTAADIEGSAGVPGT